MKIGYARVSTQTQDNKLQYTELKKSGCERVFKEKASGGRWDRPQLHKMLDQLRESDVVVVWRLDRLSRSLKDLLVILERIDAAGARFCSLTEHRKHQHRECSKPHDDANGGIICRVRARDVS